jgi:hypothetical protein
MLKSARCEQFFFPVAQDGERVMVFGNIHGKKIGKNIEF